MKSLTQLRALGWSVVVHNDYKSNGLPMTFWLLTHPSDHWIKGETTSDDEALNECLKNAADRCPCCTSAKEPKEQCICPEWCPNS